MTAIFPSSRPNISVRVIPKIPATMHGVGGIGVTKENGVWTIEPAWDDLALIAPGTLLDPVTKELWVHDPVTDVYYRMTLASLGQALFWGSSTTSVLIGAGIKTFTTQSGKDWPVGSFIQAFSNADKTNFVIGQITSYVGNTLMMNALAIGGSGSHADWTLVMSTLPGGGAPGATGSSAGLNYGFVAGLSGDPGSGKVGFNNAAIPSITQLRVSKTDRNGVNLALELGTWDDSTSVNWRAKVRVYSPDAPVKFVIVTINGNAVDNGTYMTFPVTTPVGATLPDIANCQVEVLRTGDVGQQGPQGVPGGVVTISDTPPVGPLHGQEWFESDTGKTYIWYNDGTSAQWIQTNIGGGSSGDVADAIISLVDDFHAVGDGVTDDTAAWISAISYMDANGGTLVIPDTGSPYKITAGASFLGFKSFSIAGSGHPTIINYGAGTDTLTGGHPVEIRQGNITIRDVNFWGNAKANGHGLKLQKLPNVHLENCSFYLNGGDGFHADGTYGAIISNCGFGDCGGSGIYFVNGGGNASKVVTSKFNNMPTCGIKFDNGPHFRPVILGNDFETNGVGIELGGAYALIQGNYSEAHTTFFIRAQAATGRKFAVSIRNNSILDEHALSLTQIDGLELIGNLFYYPGVTLGSITDCTNVQQNANYFAAGSSFTSTSGPGLNAVALGVAPGKDTTYSPTSFANCVFATAAGNQAAWQAEVTLGANGSYQGAVTLNGATSGGVSVKVQAAAGTFNFNLPTTAGAAGQPLLSGGGGAAPMVFGTGTMLQPVLYGGSAAAATLTIGASSHGTPTGNLVIKGGLNNTITIDQFGQTLFGGVIVQENNKGLWIKDNGGTAREVFSMGASNIAYAKAPIAAGQFAILDNGYNIVLSVTDGATAPVKFASTASFIANGSIATVLGSLGPVGSHTTVQKWLQVRDNAGTILFIPAF